MLTRLKTAGLVWPTVAMLAGVALLLSLGQWQWQRKTWKAALIADRAARASAPAVPLAALLAAGPVPEYQRVTVAGTFVHAGERHLYTPLNAGPGWEVMTPLRVPSAGVAVLVDRGFVPDHLRDAGSRSAAQPTGEVTVAGRIRFGGTMATFTPANEPARNIWYWRDLKAMADGSGATAAFYIEADASVTNPGGWPRPGLADPIFNNLSNRHLEYALTWWALAATMIGVYLALVLSRLGRGAVSRCSSKPA
jgi:surfeit locus 1 family protein